MLHMNLHVALSREPHASRHLPGGPTRRRPILKAQPGWTSRAHVPDKALLLADPLPRAAGPATIDEILWSLRIP